MISTLRTNPLAFVLLLLIHSPISTGVPLTNLDESSIGILEFSEPELGLVIRDEEIKVVGDSSLRFELAGGDPVVWRIQEPIPCNAGQMYMLEAQIRCFLLGSAGMKLFVEWLDSEDRPIHVGTQFWGQKLFEDRTDWIGATASWNPERLVVRAPEEAVRVRFGCRFESVRPGRERKNRRYAWMDAISWGPTVEFEIEGKALANVFQNEEVIFNLHSGDVPPSNVSIAVCNFWEREIAKYEWIVSEPEEDFALGLGVMDPGYYELRWSLDTPDGLLPRAGTTSFCVLRPRDKPIRPAAIAVDGALSWFYRGQELIDVSNLCAKIGIQCIRDRMNWDQVEKARGEFDPDFLDVSATVQNSAGMDVYQDFGGTPPWALEEDDRGRSLPSDPLDVYRVMKNLTSHFRGRVDFWEIWNEPYHDRAFFGRPDEYVTFLKAAYLGCKAGNPNSVVLTCSFNTLPTPWGDRVIENGALEYADIYNFHSYARKENIVPNLKMHKQRMIDDGRRLPMWLTEDGSRSRRDVRGSRLEGERIAARYAVEWAVMALAEGVDRHFYFAVPEMYEGAEGPWGILRPDHTPKPPYVAIGTLREMLGRGIFLGKLNLKPGEAKAYLFDRGDGTGTVVVMPDKQRHIRVPGASAGSRAVDIMGNDRDLPFVVTEEGILEVETGIFPLYVTNLDLSVFEVENKPERWPRFWEANHQDPEERKVFLHVNVRGLEWDVPPGEYGGERRMAVWTSPDGTPLAFQVVAYNLSRRDVRLRLSYHPGDGMKVTDPPEVWMDVAAGGKAIHQGTVALEGVDRNTEVPLRLEGEAEGFRIPATVVYFKQTPTQQ